jgi:HTH-type transcriptional regulator/antitoxin HigA
VKRQWFILETEDQYENALKRYEEIKKALKGSDEYKEKMFLVT